MSDLTDLLQHLLRLQLLEGQQRQTQLVLLETGRRCETLGQGVVLFSAQLKVN